MLSNYIKILKYILQIYKVVLVAAEIIYFNGMSLLVSIYRHVKVNMAQYLGKMRTGNISKSLENINDVYYILGTYIENFTWIGSLKISK